MTMMSSSGRVVAGFDWGCAMSTSVGEDAVSGESGSSCLRVW